MQKLSERLTPGSVQTFTSLVDWLEKFPSTRATVINEAEHYVSEKASGNEALAHFSHYEIIGTLNGALLMYRSQNGPYAVDSRLTRACLWEMSLYLMAHYAKREGWAAEGAFGFEYDLEIG